MIHFNKKNNYVHLPYRRGVGLMIVNKSNKVFVAKRTDSRMEAWQMPQGGINDGESIEQATVREMEEEIGTSNCTILKKSRFWYSYDVPVQLIPKLWEGKYRGQKQKWLLIRFHGEDDEINIYTKFPEFCDWRWVELDELLELVVLFKRDLYKAVIKEFKPILKREKILK